MHSIPCPPCSSGPWGTSTFHWYHRPESNELVLVVGGKIDCRLELRNMSGADLLGHLRAVTDRGFCDEIPGALVRALVDLGYIGEAAAA